MIHHAEGPNHYAHTEHFTCDGMSASPFRERCRMPELPEGPDGKCDWCRKSDAKWKKLVKA